MMGMKKLKKKSCLLLTLAKILVQRKEELSCTRWLIIDDELKCKQLQLHDLLRTKRPSFSLLFSSKNNGIVLLLIHKLTL